MNHWFGDEWSMFVIVESRESRSINGGWRVILFWKLESLEKDTGMEDLEGLLWIVAKRGVRATVLEI